MPAKKPEPTVVADGDGNVRVTFTGPFPVYLPTVSAQRSDDSLADVIHPGETVRVSRDDAASLLDQPDNWKKDD
jgi:hypothetical protein